MVNDKKRGNHKLLNNFNGVHVFALQGYDPGSKTLKFYPCPDGRPDASLFLASINQEEYVQCQDLKRKNGKPELGARNKLMTFLIYQLECYDFTKSKIYKIRGSIPVG